MQGFTVFEADFTEYLASRRKSGPACFGGRAGPPIASALLDEVMLTRRAAEMRAGGAAGRVEQFSARLAEVAVHSRDAVIIVDGESGRLLFALNDAADQDAAPGVHKVTEQLDALLNGDLRAAAPAGIERRGRERLAALTVTAAEAWRQPGSGRPSNKDWHRWTPDWPGPEGRAGRAGDAAAELLGLDLAFPEPRRSAGRKPKILLHHRGGRRPDRAAGRRCPAPAARRVWPAGGPGAPAARSNRPADQAGRPSPRRSAVSARRGEPGDGAGGRAALCRWHRPDTVGPAGRG